MLLPRRGSAGTSLGRYPHRDSLPANDYGSVDQVNCKVVSFHLLIIDVPANAGCNFCQSLLSVHCLGLFNIVLSAAENGKSKAHRMKALGSILFDDSDCAACRPSILE